jgi:hypothetical protein
VLRMISLVTIASLVALALGGADTGIRITSQSPQLNAEASVGPGEALYSENLVREETVTKTRTVALLASDMIVTGDGIKLPAASRLSIHPAPSRTEVANFLPTALPGIPLFCSDEHVVMASTVSVVLGGAAWKKFICLQDSKGAGRFDRVVLRGYRKPDRMASAKYEVVEEEYSSYTATSKVLRGELLYQGAGGGILRLSYREYVDDLARPAFQQDATFDLNREGTTELRFKGAEIHIFEATNSGIRYKVLSGFKW